MKKRTIFLLFGISAIALTSLGYFIDTDPPYADFRTTVFEFCIISSFFFMLFSAGYLGSRLVWKNIRNLN